MLGVPLLREGMPIGVIVLSRQTVRPFTDRQIELVTTFADQAVIAIENVRLFDEVQARTREVTESLEYQTAISEVLNVISRSPSDVQPVLDTIADTAQRLCQSEQAYVMKLDRGRYYPAAGKDVQPERIEFLRQHPIAPDRGSVCGRLAIHRRTIHIIAEQTSTDDGAWNRYHVVWERGESRHRQRTGAAGALLVFSLDIIAASVMLRSAAISFKLSQNSSSTLILVLWPAMTTERFKTRDTAHHEYCND
jgi:hypothetical protein